MSVHGKLGGLAAECSKKQAGPGSPEPACLGLAGERFTPPEAHPCRQRRRRRSAAMPARPRLASASAAGSGTLKLTS